MPNSNDERAHAIRTLNDGFRKTGRGGLILVTTGVKALGDDAMQGIVNKMRSFDQFNQDNDPHGEHDFGSIKQAGQTIFWKIDYYDLDLEYRSEDPADPSVTKRVLTIMLASEY